MGDSIVQKLEALVEEAEQALSLSCVRWPPDAGQGVEVRIRHSIGNRTVI